MTSSDFSVPLVRPTFLKWSLVAFLLLMPFVAHSVWDYIDTRRLRTRLEAIARRGEPTTGAAYRLRTSKGPSVQAARYYQAAASLVSGYAAEIPAPIGQRLSVAERGGVWPADLVERARSLLDEQREALNLAERAALLPFEGFNAGTIFNYLTGNLMGVSRLCALRANIAVLDGNADAAIASIYADVKLSRATGMVPSSFSALAFALKSTHPSPEALRRLADAVAELDRDDAFKQQLIRVRAQMLDEGYTAGWFTTGFRVWDLHQFIASLDVFERLIEAAGTPAADRHAAVLAVGDWPILLKRPASARAMLESMLRFSERQTDAIRCARRLVEGEVVDCRF